MTSNLYTIHSGPDSFTPIKFSKDKPSNVKLFDYSNKIPLNAPILVHIHEKDEWRKHLFSLISMVSMEFDMDHSKSIPSVQTKDSEISNNMPQISQENELSLGYMHGIIIFLAKELSLYEIHQITKTIYSNASNNNINDFKSSQWKLSRYHIQYESNLKCAPILNRGSIVKLQLVLFSKIIPSNLIQHEVEVDIQNKLVPIERNNEQQNNHQLINEQTIQTKDNTEESLIYNSGVNLANENSEFLITLDNKSRILLERMKDKFIKNWHGNIIIRDGYYFFPEEDQLLKEYNVIVRILDWDDKQFKNSKYSRIWFNRCSLQWDEPFIIQTKFNSIALGHDKFQLVNKKNYSESISTDRSNLNSIVKDSKVNDVDSFVKTQSILEIEKLLKNQVSGIIIYGSSGVGKSFSCKKLVKNLGFGLMYLSLASIPSDELLFSLSEVSRILRNSKKRYVVILDDLNILKNNAAAISILSRSMDEISQFNSISSRSATFIGIVQKISQIPDSFRRHGRFDHEIQFLPATSEERKNIIQSLYFQYISKKNQEIISNLSTYDEIFEKIGSKSVGFYISDLISLHRESIFLFERTNNAQNIKSEFSPVFYLNTLEKGLVNPSIQKEVEHVVNVINEVKDLNWDDIGGLHDVKKKIRQSAEWPLMYKDKFKKLGLSAPRGILMYGPPGCGKTSLVKALARSTKSSFLSLNSASVYSPYFGDAEKTIREVFKKARLSSPSIIFFDEIDAMVGNRQKSGGSSGVEQRVLSTILNEMDGIEFTRDVLIVAATNRPDMIDAALLRPGRLDYVIYIPPPDYEGRFETFKVHCKQLPLGNDVDLEILSSRTEGYTGADIESVCREAAMYALRSNINSKIIHWKYFEDALETVQPSVTINMTREYEDFQNMFSKTK